MGMTQSRTMYRAYVTDAEITPDYTKSPTFDPLYGFPQGRKPREMEVSEEELESANVPLDKRDYCAKDLMAWLECYNLNYPFLASRCKHIKHHYLTCQAEDYVLRMKEYERERRLLARQRRKLES